MNEKVIAMILAGGKGTRLQGLTRKTAKPAVSFAAKYRIIDFPLSNCANSGINTVGVLTQYESSELDNYIGDGSKWGFNGIHCCLSTLAPRVTEKRASWYNGTADAIAQNIDFLDSQKADYVLILSGDHIYKTTFNKMIDEHILRKADCTISVIEVPKEDISRFGIVEVNKNNKVKSFIEKPKTAKSNLASMGIYVFTYKILRKYLLLDMDNPSSSHDFGNDILPMMMNDKRRIFVYRFAGYWRDVGTLESLHQANMDIAEGKKDALSLYDYDLKNRIYSEDLYSVPQYIGKDAKITCSIANQGSIILGKIDHSVISTNVIIHPGAIVDHAVIMQGAEIMENAIIHNAIVAPNVVVSANRKINVGKKKIVLVSK